MRSLHLYRAESFMSRLLGLHRIGTLPWHTGLYLSPCRAIHTFGLHHSIDVIFLNSCGRIVRKIEGLEPNRWAMCAAATSVVELPAGYCALYPDCDEAIRQALHDFA